MGQEIQDLINEACFHQKVSNNLSDYFEEASSESFGPEKSFWGGLLIAAKKECTLSNFCRHIVVSMGTDGVQCFKKYNQKTNLGFFMKLFS